MHRVLAALAVLLLLGPAPTYAQLLERPSDRRPELEEPSEEQPRQPSLSLPPLPDLSDADRARLSSGMRVFVREYRVVGSSVFDAEQLGEVLAPYLARDIDTEELIRARDAVTRLYLENGYVTSGALIPDQEVVDGVVEIHVVEGRLTDVEIEGARWFRDSWLRSRLLDPGDGPLGALRRWWSGERAPPLRMDRLAERLQLLQQDGRIRRIEGRVRPGARRDQSILDVVVEEAFPLRLRAEAANDLSPRIGGWRGGFRGGHDNLTGHGDTLIGEYSTGQGLEEDFEVRYALPVTRWNTLLTVGYAHGKSEVTDGPLKHVGSMRLRTEAEQSTTEVRLSQPLYLSPTSSFLVGVAGELRRAEVTIGGQKICLFVAQLESDCESRLSIVRLFEEWTYRSEKQVLASRLTTSIGTKLFDATWYSSGLPGSNEPDGDFVTWLAQVQYVRRLPDVLLGSMLVMRSDVQLSRDPLLGLEQIAVGGINTVRGYHENELVRDNGIVASLELRVPVVRDALGRDVLQIVPFFDFGKAWNDKDREGIESLSSLGLGLRYAFRKGSLIEIYWGGRLRSVPDRDGDDLQDHGIQIRASMTLF